MGNLKVAGLDIGSHNLTIDEPSGTLLVDGEEVSGSGGGGISYVWANEIARTATTGMKTDEQGLQQDTGIVYKYTGSAWVTYYSLLTPESYVAPSSGVKYVWIDEAAKLAQTGMSADEQGVQEDTNTVYKYDGTVWEEHYAMSDSTVQKYYEGTSAPINSKLGDEWFDYNDGTLYKKVSDGTDSVWMSLNSNISNATTTPEKIPLNNNVVIKVGDNEEFKTINSAIAYLSRKYYPLYQETNVTATIELQAGFIMKEQVIMQNIDLSWITLTGVDAETIIDHTYLTINNNGLNAFLGISSKMITIGQLFNMTGGAELSVPYLYRRGITAINSSLIVRSGAGVKNAGHNGLCPANNSMVVANGAIFTGAGQQNIMCSGCSTLIFVNGNGSAGKSQGVYAQSGGKIVATGANARVGASNSVNDFNVYAGGEIVLDSSSIGGTVIAVNTLSSRGIIYKV